MNKVIVISGPTACGKSDLAIALSPALPCAIINADSMQIYQGLSILTASPSKNIQSKIPHYLYNSVIPDHQYSVAEWLSDCNSTIKKCQLSNRIPIIVGGTGLYINALINGLAEVPPIDESIRNKVRDFVNNDIKSAFALLQETDPVIAIQINPQDRQRISRALEVIKSTGKSLTYWHKKNTHHKNTFDFLKIHINPCRKDIISRSNKRLQKIFSHEAIEEVKELSDIYQINKLPIYKAIGVKEISDYIAGKISLKLALEYASIVTRQYIKRQQTWLKKYYNANIIINHCYDPGNIDTIQECINRQRIREEI